MLQSGAHESATLLYNWSRNAVTVPCLPQEGLIIAL